MSGGEKAERGFFWQGSLQVAQIVKSSCREFIRNALESANSRSTTSG